MTANYVKDERNKTLLELREAEEDLARWTRSRKPGRNEALEEARERLQRKRRELARLRSLTTPDFS